MLLAQNVHTLWWHMADRKEYVEGCILGDQVTPNAVPETQKRETLNRGYQIAFFKVPSPWGGAREVRG